jgi:hypothetical protein
LRASFPVLLPVLELTIIMLIVVSWVLRVNRVFT